MFLKETSRPYQTITIKVDFQGTVFRLHEDKINLQNPRRQGRWRAQQTSPGTLRLSGSLFWKSIPVSLSIPISVPYVMLPLINTSFCWLSTSALPSHLPMTSSSSLDRKMLHRELGPQVFWWLCGFFLGSNGGPRWAVQDAYGPGQWTARTAPNALSGRSMLPLSPACRKAW